MASDHIDQACALLLLATRRWTEVDMEAFRKKRASYRKIPLIHPTSSVTRMRRWPPSASSDQWDTMPLSSHGAIAPAVEESTILPGTPMPRSIARP